MISTTPDLTNPFPGLRCFLSDEDYLFFGRHEQIENLLRRLRTNRLVAVVGASGSGKSSLVRAGLLPAVLGGGMAQAGSAWEIAVMRPGGSPMAHLAGALCDAGLYDADAEDALFHLQATLSRSRNGLLEAVRQSKAAAGSKLLLVVDQFEELFRFHRASATSQEEAVAFVNLLLQATQQTDQNIYVVLTMRSDFLGECSQFLGLAEAVNDGEFLIPRMTRDQIQEAIEGPIRVRGAEIAPRLLFRLLNDVEDNQDQLPVLQHALMRTWDLWKRAGGNAPGSLDLEHYEATGGMRAALSRHADEIFDAFPSDPHRTAAARLFKALTERSPDGRGIRRPTRLGQLVAIAGVDEPIVRLVLEAYRAPGVTFLMPPVTSSLDDTAVIDISHESLMRIWDRLRLWVEEEAQSARIYRRLHETAALHSEKQAGLYHDPDLQIALSWRDTARPNAAWAEQYDGGFDAAMRFLDTSREAAEREEREREAARQRELEQAKAIAENQRLRAEEKARSARRMRWLMRVAMGVAVVALIASIFAGMAKREALRNAGLAQEQKEEADKQRAAAQAAEAKANRDLYVSDMNRAGQAYEEGSFKELDDLLLRHVPKGGDSAQADLRGPEWYFWRQASRHELALMRSPFGHFFDLAVAPDQKTVATAFWPGNVALFDVASRNLIRQIPVNGRSWNGSRSVIAYSPDGGILAVSGPNPSQLRRWDTRTWQPLSPDLTFPDGNTNEAGTGQPSRISALAFSPERPGGFLLAVGTENGRVALWDCRTWQVIKVLELSDEKPESNALTELAFSPDGSQLAGAVGPANGPFTSSDMGALVIWDVARPEQVTRRPSKSPLLTLAFSPDGHRLVSGHADGAVNLWEMNPDPSSVPEQLYKARDLVVRIRFSPSGRYLAASTSEGNAILVGELEPTPRMVSRLKGHSKPSRIEFVGDDFTLWSAGEDNSLRVWDVRESGVAPEIAGSQWGAGTCYLAGGRLAWRSPPVDDHDTLIRRKDGRGRDRAGTPSPIRVYDVATARELPPWQEGVRFTIHAASSNGRFLAAQGEDGRIRLWDAASGKPLGTTAESANEAGHETGLLTVSDDGSQVAWVELDPEDSLYLNLWNSHGLQLWSPHTGRRVRVAGTELAQKSSAVALSHDGSMLAFSRLTGSQFPVTVWDIASERPVLLKTVSGNPVFSMAFSPDGTRLACGQWNSEIYSIEPRTGRQLGSPLLGHAGLVGSVAFSPDGNTLYSGSLDNTIRLWDVSTGIRRATLPALERTFATRLIIEPEGRWMVSSLTGQAARLWRLDDAFDPKRAEMFWREEGITAAERGDFARARKVTRQAVQQAPDQAEGSPWHALAALAVHEGDLEDFRKVRCEMLARYADKPYRLPAVFVAKVCTMLPATPEELEAGRKLAEMVIGDGEMSGFPDSWANVCLILADYRQGNYKAAAERAEQSLAVETRSQVPQIGLVLALGEAMSQHQLGHPAEAGRALAKARELMALLDEQYPGSADRPSGQGWIEWMFDKALLAEAEALIEGKR